MNPFESIDAETLVAGRTGWLTADAAERLTAHPLSSVDTEYPHHCQAIEGPDGPPHPADQHPVFFGCYDWHSAVHSHWCLVRMCRLVDHPDQAAITDRIDARFTPENVAGEVAFLRENPQFEKPYGWAWLLRLAAELALWDDDRADRWRSRLRPIEELIVDRVQSEFLTDDRPFRVGTHANSAFALTAVLDYAAVVNDEGLAATTQETARRFYLEDESYPIEYEPLGWDFLSPALAEADLMRRVLDRVTFREWVDDFLPALSQPSDGVLAPVAVDPETEDGGQLHLVGLNLSRAWCLAGLAEAFDGPRARTIERVAASHAEHGVQRAFTDAYAGAHWLSSFVLYLISHNESGIAPEA